MVLTDLSVYFPLFPEAFNRDLRSNIDTKYSMDLVVYFLKPLNIDNKSSMDLKVYFLLFPEDFNRYLKRNINN